MKTKSARVLTCSVPLVATAVSVLTSSSSAITPLLHTTTRSHSSDSIRDCDNACPIPAGCNHQDRGDWGAFPLGPWLLLSGCPWGPGGPRKLIEPILETILLPTASTAPLGEVRVGPSGAVSCTLKSLIAVPFHMPTVPLVICISPLKMKLQIRDSYQPSAKGDHSNECTRTGEGSTPTNFTWLILCKVAGEARSEIRSCRGTRTDTC